MKYEEAVKLINTLPSTIDYKEVVFKLFIVPADNGDFKRYMSFYKGNKVSNETALKYSSNGDFTIHGLHRHKDFNWFLQLNEILNITQKS